MYIRFHRWVFLLKVPNICKKTFLIYAIVYKTHYCRKKNKNYQYENSLITRPITETQYHCHPGGNTFLWQILITYKESIHQKLIENYDCEKNTKSCSRNRQLNSWHWIMQNFHLWPRKSPIFTIKVCYTGLRIRTVFFSNLFS